MIVMGFVAANARVPWVASDASRPSRSALGFQFACVHPILKILRVVVVERAFDSLAVGIHEVSKSLGGVGCELRITGRVEAHPVHFPGTEERVSRQLHARVVER